MELNDGAVWEVARINTLDKYHFVPRLVHQVRLAGHAFDKFAAQSFNAPRALETHTLLWPGGVWTTYIWRVGTSHPWLAPVVGSRGLSPLL